MLWFGVIYLLSAQNSNSAQRADDLAVRLYYTFSRIQFSMRKRHRHFDRQQQRSICIACTKEYISRQLGKLRKITATRIGLILQNLLIGKMLLLTLTPEYGLNLSWINDNNGDPSAFIGEFIIMFVRPSKQTRTKWCYIKKGMKSRPFYDIGKITIVNLTLKPYWQQSVWIIRILLIVIPTYWLEWILIVSCRLLEFQQRSDLTVSDIVKAHL